ncbi:unnamed protein product [Acanthoscelides obtectus]|uniref:Uncharacterized protein n=1 Tax=Acanthoscelides obtectus TaxID=200917 RepID=A0A9P0M7R0_ACAOB|nr:unnamed protein product [Acanthoscelides obtectus]CAK1622465.1 hypothetical protein AOBTE_LOCUS1501 [Acanthoscelides obtectus]
MESTSEGSLGDPSITASGEGVKSGVPERLDNTNPSEALIAADIERDTRHRKGEALPNYR